MPKAKEALTAAGLALVPVSQDLVSTERHKAVRRRFLLVQTSGESMTRIPAWPVVPDRGRSFDKTFAGAVTTSLAYLVTGSGKKKYQNP